MAKIKGNNIKEVWNYRLSAAAVYIDRRGGTWVCVVSSKSNPDHVDGNEPTPPLETHDTGIKSTKGDAYDTKKLKVCFEWFKSVRDKYALPGIEELKPLVVKAEKLQAEYAEITKGMDRITARTSKDAVLKLDEMDAFKLRSVKGSAA